MKFLLDTHLLLWAVGQSKRLSNEVRQLIESPAHQLVFSATSLWEVAVKSGLDRADFQVDAKVLRRSLVDNGYLELAITGEHVVAVAYLPPLHRDPFDRLLVAQAQVEGITLLTSDPMVASYPGPVRKV